MAAATRRADAARARVHVLEKARKEAAQDVRTLLDKSEGDDELVSALREEVHRLREQAAAAESRAAQAGTASRPAVVRDHAAEARQKEVERSLRRKVEEQKATLARLEDELQQASSGGGGRGAEASGPGVSIARSAREQSLGIEVGRLKETMGALQDKLHQAREREEEQQSRIADLERTCIHLEGRLARRGGQASQAEAGPNVHALHAELKQRGGAFGPTSRGPSALVVPQSPLLPFIPTRRRRGRGSARLVPEGAGGEGRRDCGTPPHRGRAKARV